MSQTPFAAKDGLNKEQAVKLCQEFTNIGMRAQIVRSKKKPVPIEEKKKSFLEYLFNLVVAQRHWRYAMHLA